MAKAPQTRCPKCDYVMHRPRVGHPCPECGTKWAPPRETRGEPSLDQLPTEVVARLAAHLVLPALLMGSVFLLMILWRTDLAVQNLMWTPSDSIATAGIASVIGLWAWGLSWPVPSIYANRRGCGAVSRLRLTVRWGAGIWVVAAALLVLRGPIAFAAASPMLVVGNIAVVFCAVHMVLTVQYARRLGRWMQLEILDRAAIALLGLPLLVALLLITMGVRGTESGYAAVRICQVVAVIVAWVIGVNAFHTFMHALEARGRAERLRERSRE